MQLPFRSAAPPQPAPESVSVVLETRGISHCIYIFKLSCGVFIHLYPTRSSFFRERLSLRQHALTPAVPDKGFGRYFPSVLSSTLSSLSLLIALFNRTSTFKVFVRYFMALLIFLSFRLLSIFGKSLDKL